MLKQCRYKFDGEKIISNIFPANAEMEEGWALDEETAEELFKNPQEETEKGGWTKAELEEYAKEEFGVDLDKRKSLKTLIQEVEELENDDSSGTN